MDNDVKVSNKKIQINIRLDEKTKNMLFELANKDSRSQNNYIAYLIKQEYEKLMKSEFEKRVEKTIISEEVSRTIAEEIVEREIAEEQSLSERQKGEEYEK